MRAGSDTKIVDTPKPYANTKASGADTLDEIPSHWHIARLGHIGHFFKGGGGTKEDESETGSPCVRYGDLYTNHDYFIHDSRSRIPNRVVANYTPIRHGDVLFAGSGETIDEIGKSAVNLIPGSTYCGGDVIIFRPRIDMDPAFLGYATACCAAQIQKSRMGRGITVMHIYGDDLKRLFIALPPLYEQFKVSEYLKAVDVSFKRFVSAKHEIIKQLMMQKVTVIQMAVTQGTIADVSLNPSGIEWLGSIPVQWNMRRLKQLCTISGQYGANISPDLYMSHGTRFLRTTDIDDDGGLLSAGVYVHIDQARDHTLKDGDLLLSRSGTVGRSFVYSADTHGPCAYAGYLVRFSPRDYIVPKYLYYFTKSQSFAQFVRRTAISSTIDNVNAERFANAHVPLPPFAEQVAIVDYLNAKIRAIDAAISRARSQVQLAHEYCERLIVDVVTGRYDVRELIPDVLGEGHEF